MIADVGMDSEQTVRDRLRSWATVQPDKNFVQCGGGWLSYGDVATASDSLSGNLQRLGVAKGQQIAFLLPNRIEYVLLFLACAELGVLQVPLNPYLRGEFLHYQLADSEASTIITDRLGIDQIRSLLGRLPALERLIVVGGTTGEVPGGFAHIQVVDYDSLTEAGAPAKETNVSSSDLCSIMYTSGTTGLPKGCMMSNGYYLTICRELMTAEWIAHDDILFTAYQLFHTSGQIYGLTTALNSGASVVLEPEFSASRYMQRVRETGATVVYGPGSMALSILAQQPQPDDADNRLRLAMWLPLSPEKQTAFERRFGTRVSSETYGQTEALIPAMSSLADERRPGSAGRLTPYFEVRLVDEDDREVPLGAVGEISVRPRHPLGMFSGYWHNPEATVRAWRNLWHHTGDFGRLDSDGYLTFVDRKKDSLRRRGENVSSMELERAILEHAGVDAVAVHAVKSEMSEDDIKACILAVPGSELVPSELFGFFKESLPYYAIPRYVEIVDELPRNHMGRVLKFELVKRGVTPETWDFEQLGLVVPRQDRRSR